MAACSWMPTGAGTPATRASSAIEVAADVSARASVCRVRVRRLSRRAASASARRATPRSCPARATRRRPAAVRAHLPRRRPRAAPAARAAPAWPAVRRLRPARRRPPRPRPPIGCDAPAVDQLHREVHAVQQRAGVDPRVGRHAVAGRRLAAVERHAEVAQRRDHRLRVDDVGAGRADGRDDELERRLHLRAIRVGARRTPAT